jgi:hypothetical protein
MTMVPMSFSDPGASNIIGDIINMMGQNMSMNEKEMLIKICMAIFRFEE